MRRPTRTLLATTVALAAAVVTAPAAQAAPDDGTTEYVALGDSYTSAPFVPQLIPARGCAQSTNNYPRVLARTLGWSLTDVSCSGADTSDVYASQLPGVAPQLDAVTPTTDVVSVSIGGNDESVFGTLVGFCTTLRATDPTGDPCREAMKAGGGRDRLFAAVSRTRDRVDQVVADVRARAPQAEVVVVGYPQIVPTQGTCPDLLPLADGDYAYARVIGHRLSQALARAAHRNGATYVDLTRASRGHDICSDDPWVSGQFFDPTRALQYHPYAVEQAAVAGLIVRALR